MLMTKTRIKTRTGTDVEDRGVDEDEVEDEEVWGPWLPAGPSGGLISGMCASLARSSSTSSSRSFSPRSLKGSLFKSRQWLLGPYLTHNIKPDLY